MARQWRELHKWERWVVVVGMGSLVVVLVLTERVLALEEYIKKESPAIINTEETPPAHDVPIMFV